MGVVCKRACHESHSGVLLEEEVVHQSGGESVSWRSEEAAFRELSCKSDSVGAILRLVPFHSANGFHAVL